MATRLGVKFTAPKKLFDIPKGRAAKDKALDTLAEEAVKDFDATVATWKGKPDIRVQPTTNTRQIYVIGNIYGYVDKGTAAHIIRPRRVRVLSFLGGYKSKTRPNVIGSSGGGASGPRVFAKYVNHPGNAPRNFSVTIAEKMQKRLAVYAKEFLKKYGYK